MNKDIMEGKWEQMKGSIQSKWGEISDDDLDVIDGQRRKFVGVIQERYGKSKEEAEEEVEKFCKEHDC